MRPIPGSLDPKRLWGSGNWVRPPFVLKESVECPGHLDRQRDGGAGALSWFPIAGNTVLPTPADSSFTETACSQKAAPTHAGPGVLSQHIRVGAQALEATLGVPAARRGVAGHTCWVCTLVHICRDSRGLVWGEGHPTRYAVHLWRDRLTPLGSDLPSRRFPWAP